ncbi:hypothetical protein BH09BAC5_BH09BAC5_10160 [soil metagenome]
MNYKFNFVLFLFSFLLFSCAAPEESATVNSDSENTVPSPPPPPPPPALEPLINSDSLSEIDTSASQKNISQSAVDIIEGTVTYTLSYCGGARPSPEILAEYAKAKLFVNSTLKLKNSSGEYFLKTDKNGNFKEAIPVGTYKVYLTKNTDKKVYDVSPENCSECLKQVKTTVKIKPGKNNSFQISFQCADSDRMRP